MLETIFYAKILDINPFDQPAVEEGKKFAKETLNK
jgi:glucose-6-phosphate isomerase